MRWITRENITVDRVAEGFAALGTSDEERPAREFPVYDALLAYVGQAVE